MNQGEALVAVIPPVPTMGEDRIFERGCYQHFGDATHWMEPFWELRETTKRGGFELRTWDLVDLEDAAALMIMDVLLSPHEVEALRRQHPHLKVVQQILETPLGKAWVFDPRNHQTFDAVITYNDQLVGRPGYFVFKIPAGGLKGKMRKEGKVFSERKLGCMVANVPNPAPLLPRHSGWGMMRKGWSFSLCTWWNYAREGGSLYRERLSIAACFAELAPDEFDIFGPDWDRINNPAIRKAWKGPWAGSKLDLFGNFRFTIAYENCRNDAGYISEKIFDAMLGGTVPVYMGNERIAELVPPASFVDARAFGSRQALLEYMAGMSEAEWKRMRMAGEEFLRNGAEERFGSKQYGDAVMAALRTVLPPLGAEENRLTDRGTDI